MMNKAQRLQKAKKEHEKFLKRMGVKSTRSSGSRHLCIPSYKVEDRGLASTSDQIPVVCTTKDRPKYTGTEIIGIATMHKSNAVPVRRKADAADISKMRR